MAELINHLFQSTLFAALVGLTAFALRRNSAQTRYWLWMSASMKFLIPFSLLVSLGSRVEVQRPTPVVDAIVVEQITSTFAPAPPVHSTISQPSSPWWPMALVALWMTGTGLLLLRWFRQWLRIRGAVRCSKRFPSSLPIPVCLTESSLEPGVFGTFRPVLLLPDGITEKLSAEELDSIISHELSHVRRHDNLTAAIHMLMESLFWFHPLVWWIGCKLVEERERACDEAVLQEGKQPQVYAQGILNVCKLYLESPLPCAAGVTGADLKRRIHNIMTHPVSLRLTFVRKAMIASAAIVALAVPFTIGVLRAQTLPPPPKFKYEVATIRPNKSDSQSVRISPGPQGGIRTENTSVLSLISFAYDMRDYQFVGGPGWIRTERFDVTATPDKAEEAPSPGMPREKFESHINRQRERMQALLAERFGLVLRVEKREQPYYSLTLAKGGSKLVAAKDPDKPNMSVNRGRMVGNAIDMGMITRSLSTIVGRTVTDDTGLSGHYDLKVEWTPDSAPVSPGEPPPPLSDGASLFTALREQLGLKLESKKGPVPVFVIEKVEKPTEN